MRVVANSAQSVPPGGSQVPAAEEGGGLTRVPTGGPGGTEGGGAAAGLGGGCTGWGSGCASPQQEGRVLRDLRPSRAVFGAADASSMEMFAALVEEEAAGGHLEGADVAQLGQGWGMGGAFWSRPQRNKEGWGDPHLAGLPVGPLTCAAPVALT